MTKFNTLIILLLTMLLTTKVSAHNTIKDTRIWVSPEKTRIVFDLNKAPAYNLFTLRSPNRLVVDLRNTKYSKSDLERLTYKKGLIKNIRSGVRKHNDIRIVFDLSSKINYSYFSLKPNEQYKHRLVIDIASSPSISIKTPTISKSTREKPKEKLRDIIIALDAGHGGDDPGAIGRKGNYEKTIVLKIAKELEKLIKKEHGMKPLMIRSGDYYVPLKKRTAIARKHKADLLLSIHADSFHTAAAEGASVYALSKRGATSEAARRLATRENNSDLIGGIGGSVELKDKDKVLASVLLDLSQTATINASLNLGGIVLNQLNQITELHKFSVEKANFTVLRSPDIPSLLIETGFISNPKEERKLSSHKHRRRLAKSIMTSINKYFRSNPPPGTHLHARLKKGSYGQLSTALN